MRWTKPQWKQAVPWLIGGAAGLLFATSFAGSAYFNYAFLRPRRKQNKTSDLNGYVPEAVYTSIAVKFRSMDGLQLSALLLKPEQPNGAAIVVCHGLAHDKYSGVRFVQYLLSEGFTLLLLDFRNHGESEGSITTYGFYEKYDLLSAIRFLRHVEGVKGRIGVLGASMGASVALLAASDSAASDSAASGAEEIQAVVADSPFASLKTVTTEWALKTTRLPAPVVYFPMNLAYLWLYLFFRCSISEVEPCKSVRKMRCPLLLIHGENDLRIPAFHSQLIYENACCEKELWLEKDTDHLGVYLKFPDQYRKRVSEFFKKNLL